VGRAARLGVAGVLLIAAGWVLAQGGGGGEPPTPTADAPAGVSSEASDAGQGVTIDNTVLEIDAEALADQLPGVELVTPAAEPDDAEREREAAQPDSQLAEFITETVPDTNIASIDNAVGIFANSIAGLFYGLIGALPRLLLASILLLLVWLILAIVCRVARQAFVRMRLRESLRDLFLIFIRTGGWLVGLLVAAGVIFPDFGLTQILASAGLVTIAIGFAFQDIFENFFAGILILWRFPFENGDYIEVEGIVGKVEDVEVRMTKLRLTTGELVLIPNSMIFKNVVNVETNWPARRYSILAGVAYGEDADRCREIIQQAVESCERVKTERGVQVFANEFGASSVNFEVAYWAGPTPLDKRESMDEVIRTIKRVLDEEGIEIPYPYRTLTFSPNEPDIIKAITGRGATPSPPGGADASETGDG
jgi:small-conductance mechanosensitive channel